MSRDGDRTKKKLAEYDGEDKIISSFEADLGFRKSTEPIFKVKSGFPTLDRLLDGGFEGGELYAVSGPTKHGKTLFCQSISVNLDKRLIPTLWFSFEVPARQFLARFPNLPLIYMPSKLKAHALPWLEERIYESFAKFSTRVFFVDHLHYLLDIARIRNPSLEIGAVIRTLKRICVDGGFVGFILCHTTKGRSGPDLSFDSIRDSSFVSQEADSVLMIRRTPEEGPNRAALRMEFHRRTGIIEEGVHLIKTPSGMLSECGVNP
jgi:predicted ATP-dependent serine protease